MIKFKTATDKSLFLRELGKDKGDVTHADCNEIIRRRRERSKVLSSKVTDFKAIQVLQQSCGNKPFNGHLINYITGYDVDRLTMLIALSSIRTHLLIEMQYYTDIITAISLDNFYSMADDLLADVSQAINSDIKFADLQDKSKAFLVAVANKNGLAIRLAERYKCPIDGVKVVLNNCLVEFKKDIEQSFMAYNQALSSTLQLLEQVDGADCEKHN